MERHPDWDSRNNDEWLTNDNAEVVHGGSYYELATDHATAIVTREMWEAERNGGWIAWGGGECPVEKGALIDTKHRDGEVRKRSKCGLNGNRTYCGEGLSFWRHDGDSAEVIACRIHTPAQHENEEMTPSATPTPYTHRDTIIHCQAIIEDCQRAIAKHTEALASEGFELISQINAQIESADDSHNSMSDWENWKIGDLVEFVEDDGDYKKGQKAAIINVEDSGYMGSLPVELAIDWPYIESIKWHSRP